MGRTPQIDGTLKHGEWSDATPFHGVQSWVAEFSPVHRDRDLALRGWVKHDATTLYFAFEITDDVLYGIDTERWLPPENPQAHALSPEGFPWFGDEMELLLNACHRPDADIDPTGDGRSWQMVCNLTKSRLGGIGTGGLLEGEPRTSSAAWNTYRHWIESGAQTACARALPSGKGYVLEWAIRFNPCVERAPGRFYSPADGPADIGLNIAVGDLDRPEQGTGNFGRFHHEQWWAGAPHTRTHLNNFGFLRLMGSQSAPPSTNPPRRPH
jgi:SSS family solute:Na+ symporter